MWIFNFQIKQILVLILFIGVLTGNIQPIEANETIISNYQIPCQPGTVARGTTWHSDGSLDRWAYDWVCTDSRDVYAPHGGIVKYSQDYGGQTQGMIMIEDNENNACLILLHLDPSDLLVKVGDEVQMGQHLSSYTISQGHVHMAAISGGCVTYYHSLEQPIIFNEIEYVLPQRLTLEGTHPLSDGSPIIATVGNVVPSNTPSLVCESPNTTFCDVPTDHPHYDGIESAYQSGMIQGYIRTIDGVDYRFFDPEDPLFRQHAAYLIGRWLYSYNFADYASVLPPAMGLFPDLTGDGEADRVLEQLYRDGIFNGFSNGNMGPIDEIKRREFVYAIVRVLQKHQPIGTVSCDFPDINSDPEIRLACDLGLVSGVSSGQFDPDRSITRGEAMTVICRAFLTCDPVIANGNLGVLRGNARTSSPLGQLCFTASGLARPVALDGLLISNDGQQVCYLQDTDTFVADNTLPTNVEFRASPSRLDDSFNCLEEGLISLDVSSLTSSGVVLTVNKCDDSDFQVAGSLDILANGQVVSGLSQSYEANVSNIRVEFNPLEYGFSGLTVLQGRLQSSDVPSGDYKLTGESRLWYVTTPVDADYEHQVSNDNYICAPGNILRSKFDTSGNYIFTKIRKCNGEAFGTSGRYYILVDGVRTWGPFYYEAGQISLGVYVDHSGDRGLFPTSAVPSTYRVELYSDDQPNLPKYTHEVNVWTNETPACHELNVQISPANAGGVTVDPAPNCGTYYVDGTTVTITALPATNTGFSVGAT